MIFNYDVSGLQNIIDSQQEQISAYVETTNTASRDYSVGDYIFVNRLLYRVIASISNGGTFTIGTNIAKASVGSEIRKVRTHIYGNIIAANASVSIEKKSGNHLYLVFVMRGSESSYAGVWLCDQWGEIITLHSSAIATLTNAANSFELQNNMSVNIDYGVICFSDMSN